MKVGLIRESGELGVSDLFRIARRAGRVEMDEISFGRDTGHFWQVGVGWGKRGLATVRGMNGGVVDGGVGRLDGWLQSARSEPGRSRCGGGHGVEVWNVGQPEGRRQ